MSRRKQLFLFLVCLLLATLLFLWRRGQQVPPTPIMPSQTPPNDIHPVPAPVVVPSVATPRPSPIKPPIVPPIVVPIPTPVIPPVTLPPGQEGMHRELIPKNITVVRCYYEQELVAPGMVFGFDINGSGFTENFSQMITIDPDALDVEVRELRLVTANQIHGVIVVGADATTQYIFPKILIRHIPVFKAPEPFGVVRPGEVLDMELTRIDETGQSGHFRILTNLDLAQYKRFRVIPTTDRLEISNLKPSLPFFVEGDLYISPGVRSGGYGLISYLGNHELFRKDPLVDVVRPNVGRSGSIENVTTAKVGHRPGDMIEVFINGSGFTPRDAGFLRAHIDEFDIRDSTISFVSAGRLSLQFTVPPNVPVGVYGLSLRHESKVLYEKRALFGIVPPNWISEAKLARLITPGARGIVQVIGRDFTTEYAATLQLKSDEPGLTLGALQFQDPLTLIADIQVAPTVAPGDYLLHITRDGKPVHAPNGAIIRVTR